MVRSGPPVPTASADARLSIGQRDHPDEIATDAGLVRRLLEGQFPEWALLSIERVALIGTHNALYRLGEEMVVRLPLRDRPAATLATSSETVGDALSAAAVRGSRTSRRRDPSRGFSVCVGRLPLADGRAATPEAVADRRALAPVWIHGALDAQNLLVVDGRLRGVIDFGKLGAGDPACDVMAWKVRDADAREVFRMSLAVDDATWARSRGWALSQALIALAYYTLDTPPVLVREARKWMDEVLAE
jgi:aminoglycoside phosphotransferase (APT) family kinase protein